MVAGAEFLEANNVGFIVENAGYDNLGRPIS